MVASHCLSTDGASASPRSCLPLSPMFGWYDPLSPIVLPTYVPALDFRGLAVLSPLVSLLVSLCWMVRLPSPCCGLSPIVSFFCFPLLDGMPSRGLVPLIPQLVSQLVSQLARLSFLLVPFGVRLPACFPSCFRFLDGTRVFPSPCLPAVSQLVFVLVSLC